MNILSIDEKLERNNIFWEGLPQKRPLLSFHIGDHFFSKGFIANNNLLPKGTVVDPDKIIVENYIHDYKNMIDYANQVDQDAFYVLEPCTGFPWLEAIFGATVKGSETSFITDHIYDSIEDLKEIDFSINNKWYKKYLEFIDILFSEFGDTNPIGQPIIRGCTDTVGALIGQSEFAISILLEPEILKNTFNMIVKAHKSLINDQYSIINDFYGGYGLGFYNIWCPGKVIWYQEDLAALMAPNHHEEFLKIPNSKIVEDFDYSLVHMHPAAFPQLDSTLTIRDLKAIQINKDVGGPSTKEMLPQFMKVIESGKKLVIGMAFITEEDIDVICDNLPNHSTAIVSLAKNIDDANELSNYINRKYS